MRIFLALVALALIVFGVMLMTQQGILAQNITFDSSEGTSQWTNNQNAQVDINGDTNSVDVQSQYQVINRHSH
ncbi:hypothetical protein CSB09_03500 [Candidatus Gracilibacteria bacterium]|nr:MAG: hypothetical protein CSB09_03500 [Candidatus Gracilibacteria bacterium]